MPSYTPTQYRRKRRTRNMKARRVSAPKPRAFLKVMRLSRADGINMTQRTGRAFLQ